MFSRHERGRRKSDDTVLFTRTGEDYILVLVPLLAAAILFIGLLALFGYRQVSDRIDALKKDLHNTKATVSQNTEEITANEISCHNINDKGIEIDCLTDVTAIDTTPNKALLIYDEEFQMYGQTVISTIQPEICEVVDTCPVNDTVFCEMVDNCPINQTEFCVDVNLCASNLASELPVALRIIKDDLTPQITTSTTFITVASFVYKGTNNDHPIMKATAIVGTTTNANGQVQLYDFTNSMIIATSVSYGPTGGVQTIVDMGVISNLPTEQAIFQVRFRKSNAAAGDSQIYTFQVAV